MAGFHSNPAFGAAIENSDLVKLVSQYHDNHMTVNDLAFFMATHNYDATIKDGYVQVKIEGTIYEVVPTNPGLAGISIMN